MLGRKIERNSPAELSRFLASRSTLGSRFLASRAAFTSANERLLARDMAKVESDDADDRTPRRLNAERRRA
jgi:hypothetical protein